MKKQDSYSCFAHLLEEAVEGTDFLIHSVDRSHSGVILIAPHGGKIEPGTDVIAKKIALNDFSFYAFNGIRPSKDRNLHITSHNFDEPRCIALVKRHTHVIAIHGCSDKVDAAYLGGRDQNLKKLIHDKLRQEGIKSVLDGDKFPGENKKNICNRGTTGAGVQIELTLSLRQSNEADRVVNAVRNAINKILK